MRKILRRLSGVRQRGRGHTTVEYAIIVGLVAVASILIVTLFGDQIRALFGHETKRISGDETSTMDTTGADSADGAIHKKLGDL